VVGGTSVAVTDVASAAFGDLASSGNAYATVPLHAKSNLAIGFTRDAAAVALIDATSTRAIAFGLDALAQVALVASSAGSASYSLATTAAVASRAHAAGGLGLAGVVSANGGVNASGASAINTAGTSVALAVVGSQSQGDFAIASAGEADVGIDAVSSRSILLAGEAASSVRLLAEAVVGRLDLGLTVAAFSDGSADASGAINLAGLGRGKSNARAQAIAVVSVTRSGAGDVSIVGQSDRLVTFLGHASVATATKAAANTTLPITATASSSARLISTVGRALFSTSETSAAVIQIDASAQRLLWPISVNSIAFLAPPSQRRAAFVSVQQGGQVLSERQEGGLIAGRKHTAS
jgi:epidermal growth factor receptor substrate 15